MRYEVVEKDGVQFLRYRAEEPRPEAMEVMQFVADCAEQLVNRIMLDERALPEEFFRLRTGVAGELMQKLSQYRVKAALIIEHDSSVNGKFRDMLIEANRGQQFRSFQSAEQAEQWLVDQ